MRLGTIYKLEIGNKFIIGSTIHLVRRIKYHIYQLKKGTHDNPVLQRMFNKTKHVKHCILQENIPEDLLRYCEDIWIGSMCSKIHDNKNGLNIIDGSRITFTKEILIKKSEAQKRIMNSLTNQQKEERYSKAKESKFSKIEEIGTLISKAKKGRYLNWDNNQSFPVLQIDLEGVVVKLWASAYQAQKEQNFSASHISRVCKRENGMKSHKGFKWKFANKKDLETFNHLK